MAIRMNTKIFIFLFEFKDRQKYNPTVSDHVAFVEVYAL